MIRFVFIMPPQKVNLGYQDLFFLDRNVCWPTAISIVGNNRSLFVFLGFYFWSGNQRLCGRKKDGCVFLTRRRLHVVFPYVFYVACRSFIRSLSRKCLKRALVTSWVKMSATFSFVYIFFSDISFCRTWSLTVCISISMCFVLWCRTGLLLPSSKNYLWISSE